MTEEFVAIVLYGAPPRLSASELAQAARDLEPGAPLDIVPGESQDAFTLRAGDVRMRLAINNQPMPEDAAISSIGMADMPEQDAQRLMRHNACVMLTCDSGSAATSMEQIIAALKLGMVLCAAGGWALCLPSSGLCVKAEELASLRQMNEAGPRVWGIDESEADLPGYVKYSLWESLRREAQPANLLVGFVPAQVENSTWFFSAGHSFFGLPEVVFSEGTLDDFQTIRDLFRFIFPYFYQRPETMQAGQVVKTQDSELSIKLEDLPPLYSELQSPTGTLRVRLMGSTAPDSDWD